MSLMSWSLKQGNVRVATFHIRVTIFQSLQRWQEWCILSLVLKYKQYAQRLYFPSGCSTLELYLIPTAIVCDTIPIWKIMFIDIHYCQNQEKVWWWQREG